MRKDVSIARRVVNIICFVLSFIIVLYIISSGMIDVIMDGIVIDYAVVYDIGSLGNICRNVVFKGGSLNLQAVAAANPIKEGIKTIMEAHGVSQ